MISESFLIYKHEEHCLKILLEINLNLNTKRSVSLFEFAVR
jgi:hypothetical protein